MKKTDKVGIGSIKLFDPETKRGVISMRDIGSEQKEAEDLYFEVGNEESLQLHEGQLVQFIIADSEIGKQATDITVLSELA
jgi:cold shock CspA family protein